MMGVAQCPGPGGPSWGTSLWGVFCLQALPCQPCGLFTLISGLLFSVSERETESWCEIQRLFPRTPSPWRDTALGLQAGVAPDASRPQSPGPGQGPGSGNQESHPGF